MAAGRDIVVVGGGVIGCAIAYRLAREGADVLLLERDQVGSGASQAAAGMLAPLSDSLGHAAVVDLGVESFGLYPSFIDEIEADGGLSVECMQSGILRVALTDEDEDGLKALGAVAEERGLEVSWLGPRQARSLEPQLSSNIRGASYSQAEPQLNPSRLVETIRRAAAARGVTVREQTPVTGLVYEGSKVAGVRTPDGTVPAGNVVLAAGSWSSQAGEWMGAPVPVTPVRGQIAYLNKLDRPLRHTVMRGNTYAVPKGDGTTLVGTTLEDAGFDPRATVGGVASFLTSIQDLVPAIAETTINHTRAGLRPWAYDEAPLMGPAPGVEGLILATGHYRSGILLAPVTARIISDLILKGSGSVDLGPFDAARLEKAPA